MRRPFAHGLFAPALLALTTLCAPTVVFAQDDEEAAADERRNARDFENEVVREIVRGYYLKADIGSTMYLNTHSLVRAQGPLLSGVMALGIGIGGDFIDRERFSAAWEVQFGQGLFNGPLLDEIVPVQAARPLIQGDIHTFAGTAVVELSTYFTRRFSLGARAGGGVMVIPLLMDEVEYQNELVGAWGRPATAHEGPLPMIVFGPTIEYYTKLSHFSVGADVDLSVVLGFDIGITPVGYMKYTF